MGIRFKVSDANIHKKSKAKSEMDPFSSSRNTHRSLFHFIEQFMLTPVILVLISPLLLIISILVKMSSSGPVIYSQWRTGLNGEPFKIYKFRTLANCDQGSCFRQITPKDERLTRIGVFLRFFSFDELPQLYNVLKGNMSIIGPRPHHISMDRHFSKIIDKYYERYYIRPGITGWAQINGYRGTIVSYEDMYERVKHDLDYIKRRSLGLNIKILLKTLGGAFIANSLTVDSIYADTRKRKNTNYLLTFFKG